DWVATGTGSIRHVTGSALTSVGRPAPAESDQTLSSLQSYIGHIQLLRSAVGGPTYDLAFQKQNPRDKTKVNKNSMPNRRITKTGAKSNPTKASNQLSTSSPSAPAYLSAL